METEARYTLIGAFSIGVIALGLAFVYWLGGGGIGSRTAFDIRYDSPVSGLIKGSAVLFNGMRVGEVTSLGLDPAAPNGVTVGIAVDKGTPVRADTRAGIDFQGLTGSPVVTLTGGTSQQPLLTAAGGQVPALAAEKNAGQSMTQSARDVLRNIDRVVADNAEPLRSLIANIDKFAGALARNSDRIDGLVAGLERFTGGGSKPPSVIYELAAPKLFPDDLKRPQVQLAVLEATTLSIFDTDKIVLRGAVSGKPVLDNGQWPDILPKVLQVRLVQSFENAKFAGAVGRVPETVKTDYQLTADIRAFQVTETPEKAAEVELAVKVLAADGRIAGARVFRKTLPLASLETPTAAKAVGAAFEAVATDIVQWTLSLL